MRLLSLLLTLHLLLASPLLAQLPEGTFIPFQNAGLDQSVQSAFLWNEGVVLSGSFTAYNDQTFLNGIGFLKEGSITAIGNGPTHRMNTQARVQSAVVHKGELFAIGIFYDPDTAFPYRWYTVSRWDGTSWIPDGQTATSWASGNRTLAISFGDHIVAVNGQTVERFVNGQWQPIGNPFNGTVNAIAVYNGELMVGGSFVMTGDLNRLARWDGQQWRSMDVGVNGTVRSFIVHNDSLFAAGEFTQEGIAFPDVRTLNRVAVWRNGGWYPVGNGVDTPISGLGVYQGRLAALRQNSSLSPEISAVFTWNGTTWEPLELPFSGIRHLRNLLQIGEESVFVGDFEDTAVGVKHIAVQNETSLYPRLDLSTQSGLFSFIRRIVPYRGEIAAIGTLIAPHPLYSAPVNAIATWNGQRWNVLATSITDGRIPSAGETILHAHNDTLYFTRAGRVYAYDGTQISQVGPTTRGDEFHLAMTHFNHALYIGGRFSGGLLRLEGQLWQSLGAFGFVNALTHFENDLIIAGQFVSRPERDVLLNNIGRLTPEGRFIAFGEGFNNTVQALAVVNGELYAAGDFTASGNTPVSKVARWDGTQWQPVGAGLGDFGYENVYRLGVYRGQLLASGQFTTSGNREIGRTARWTGEEWVSLVPGWGSGVTDFLEVDDLLYITGGTFQTRAGYSRGMIIWDGRTTVSAPTEAVPSVTSVSVYPNPAREAVQFTLPIAQSGHVQIEVFDLLGRRVLQHQDANVSAGTFHVALDVAALQVGMYVYRVQTRNEVHTGTLHRIP